MKKAILVTVIAFLAVSMLAAPVFAAPPVEKKVPVTLKWAPVSGSSIVIERRDVNGNVSHRIITQNWKVNLTIGDSVTPIVGTGVVMRQTLYRYSKPNGVVDQVVNDYYVVSFPTLGGGFEGNVHIMLANYVNSTNYNVIVVHGLFHGTGALEGQTLNAGVDQGPGANMLWEGYLLKP